MKFALAVFSAILVSATLAVVPAQTSAEDRAVLSPAAVWPADEGEAGVRDLIAFLTSAR